MIEVILLMMLGNADALTDLQIDIDEQTEKVAELENLGINISVWDLLNVVNCLGFNLDIYAEYEDEKMKLCFPPGPDANC